MCMTAVVALAFTSCKKNETPNSFVMNGTTQTFTEIYDEDNGEKAYLDGENKLQFEDEDQMMIFQYGSTKKLYSIFKFDATNNYWNEQAPYAEGIDQNPDGTAYYAFYPAENVSNVQLGSEHGQATFTLNTTQTYRADASGNVIMPKGAMYMAAKDSDATGFTNMKLNFRNICGMLSMKFYSPTGKKITSIEVKDNRFNLVGDVTCWIDQINPEALQSWFDNYQDNDSYKQQLAQYLQGIGYSVANQGNTITLNCGDGVTLGKTKAKATRFLVVMRPLALLEGMTITIHFSNAPDMVIESARDNRISPNVIRNMTTYNVG